MNRKNHHCLRGCGRECGAWLQHLLPEAGELPHVGHVVQGQQPQPVLQVVAEPLYNSNLRLPATYTKCILSKTTYFFLFLLDTKSETTYTKCILIFNQNNFNWIQNIAQLKIFCK